MWDANVGTTERVLAAATSAATPRIAYVSTVGIFGDTHGREVDETYRRDLKDGFLSCYDETKFRAHEVAEAAIAGWRADRHRPARAGLRSGRPHPDRRDARGRLPRPAAVRRARRGSPGDGSRRRHGRRHRRGARSRPDPGEAYVVARRAAHARRPRSTVAARVGGHRPPRLTVPTGLLRAIAPINDRLGGLPGMPANLRETIAAAQASFLASHDKAARELGFAPRSLEQGIVDTYGVHS